MISKVSDNTHEGKIVSLNLGAEIAMLLSIMTIKFSKLTPSVHDRTYSGQ